MRAEVWMQINGFEKKGGLGDIVAGRRGVEDIYRFLKYKRTDWKGLEGLGGIEMDLRRLEGVEFFLGLK